MKTYKVFYVIKKDNHAYLHNMEIESRNQKEAKVFVKEIVKAKTNRHAFHVTCKEPIETNYGLRWDGMIYTCYDPLLERLW